MKQPHVLCGIGVVFLVLPGCIVGEIRDSLKTANDQLVCVQFAMDEANKGLATANELLERTNDRLDRVEDGLTRLDRTNTLIDNVEQGLGRIDYTNSNLGDLQTRLAMLESIQMSLSRLDQHLAGLRKTVGALDGVIPFLDLGGEYVEPTVAEPLPVQVSATGGSSDEHPQGDAAATVPAEGTTSAEQPAKRDALLGAWVSVYPER